MLILVNTALDTHNLKVYSVVAFISSRNFVALSFAMIINDISVFTSPESGVSPNIPRFMSKTRNIIPKAINKDQLIEWMIEMLNHSFVIDEKHTYSDTFAYFEDLIREYRQDSKGSRLIRYVPSVGKFHTPLPLFQAFKKYDAKYAVTQRHFVAPTFNEVRHILNLAQCMELGASQLLKMISFDGDQTLYSDGGNFEKNEIIAKTIHELLKHDVKVVVITAAGYGTEGSKYAVRLQGLLDSFIEVGLTSDEVERFYVVGGECNYYMKAHYSSMTIIELIPVQDVEMQCDSLNSESNPVLWSNEEINQILDVGENVMNDIMNQMRLRVRILRKDRAIGMFPGGDELIDKFPKGHGHKKIKKEALDECVLRIAEKLRVANPPINLPYCVFNGGRDCWLDIGNKSVAVKCLQDWFKIKSYNCLHVGDQFLQNGNDFAARSTCPTIWITSPHETEKILEHLLSHMNTLEMTHFIRQRASSSNSVAEEFCVYSGTGGSIR